MSLNINPPNFSGLSSPNVTNLNLTVPGALGLQAYQVRSEEELKQAQMQLAREDAIRRAGLDNMQIKQQGELGLRQDQRERQKLGLLESQMKDEVSMNNRKLDLAEQQSNGMLRSKDLAQQLKEQQRIDNISIKQLGLRQKDQHHRDNLGTDQQKLMLEYQKQVMSKLKDEKKETLKEKGAHASYMLMSLENAKTPEEANQISNMAINEAVEKGYVTKEQAKYFSKLPISLRKEELKKQIINFGVASEHVAMNKQKGAEGSTKVTLSDGTVIESQGLTKANETEAQKKVMSTEKDLSELGNLRKEFQEKYFTKKGQFQNWSSKAAEEWKGVPIMEQGAEALASFTTGKDPEARKKDIREHTKYANAVEQFFFKFQHDISGAAVAKDEVARLKEAYINGNMSPSEFQGALDQVISKTVGENEFNKHILGEGLNVSNDLFTQYRNHPDYKDWSDDKIKRAIKMMEK